MTYLEELWRDLFNKDITTVEQSVMIGVSEQFERDAPVTMLAAILVRMLFLMLIEHKASPFRVLHNFSQAMEENRRSISLINKTYGELQGEMVAFRIDIQNAQKALWEIREYADAKTGYDPFRGYFALPTTESPPVSNRMIAALIAACFAAAFFGTVIALMVLLS